MDINYFNKKIKETIEARAYDVYLVKPDKEVTCPCMNITTNQSEPSCKKCLGTGHKIMIKKIKVAGDEEEDNVAGRGVKGSAAQTVKRTFYIDAKYTIDSYDLIIDKDEVFYIYRFHDMKSFKGEITHREVMAILKRNDQNIILKNFNNIMENYKKRRKIR